MMKKRPLIDKNPERLKVREKLGIPQEQYAMFCGISKSLLSMIELNERSWPAGKSDHELIIAFLEAEKQLSGSTQVAKLTEKEIKELTIERLKRRVACYNLERKLEASTFAYNQACNLLKACALLKQKFTAPDSTEVLLINAWEINARLKQNEKSVFEQQMLKIKIEGLKKEMELIDEWLSKNEP